MNLLLKTHPATVLNPVEPASFSPSVSTTMNGEYLLTCSFTWKFNQP